MSSVTPVNGNQKYNNHIGFSVPCTMLPKDSRNFCLFNLNKVNYIASQKENAIPYVKNVLKTSNDENEIVETLFIVDRLVDNGTKGIPLMYSDLAKFNNTDSPNVQAYLAGIYRKIQIPDAFGPLINMLMKNCSTKPISDNKTFDPNEEIGGAILEYIRNYSNNPKPIDYSA